MYKLWNPTSKIIKFVMQLQPGHKGYINNVFYIICISHILQLSRAISPVPRAGCFGYQDAYNWLYHQLLYKKHFEIDNYIIVYSQLLIITYQHQWALLL